MNRRGSFVWLLLALLILGEANAVEKTGVIVAGSELAADVIRDLVPDMAVETLIPGPACPGHFDMKGRTPERLAQARLVVIHDWQAKQPFFRQVSVPEGKLVVASTAGNWMVPTVQIDAVRALADLLSRLRPDAAAIIRGRAEMRIRRIEALAEGLREKLRAARPLAPVLADVMQTPLLNWAEIPVAASFGRPEETGPRALEAALEKAREARVGAVVENLQSSGDAGKALAESLGVPRVVLTNFPAGFPSAPTYETALAENIGRLLQTLGKP